MEHKLDLDKDSRYDSNRPVKFPFREAIGALMYLATGTRPDIATAVNILSRYQNCTRQKHVVAVKQVFRYLRGTKDLTLTYYKDNQHPLFGASDSNFAKEPKARSRTGFCIFRGGAVCIWKTQVQTAPALSTAEAEYRAACSTTQKIVWARQLLEELGLTILDPSDLQIDNHSAIKMGKNLFGHKRTMHMSAKEQFLNYHYENNEIAPKNVDTKDNPSDHFTKSLPRSTFEKHRSTILGKPNNDQFLLSKELR